LTDERLRLSRKQERRGAKVYGGTVNAGSGNQNRKNDVRCGDISIEFKRTDKLSYSLKREELRIAHKNAMLEGREMVFGVEIVNERYVVVSEDYFIALLGDSRRIRRMKRCTKCDEVLPREPEYWHKEQRRPDGFTQWCRICMNKKHAEYMHENKDKNRAYAMQHSRSLAQEVRDLKERSGCADCKSILPHYMLDFDHLDAESKEMSISRMINMRVSRERLYAEIEKCEVVCANCHRARTWDRLEHRYDTEAYADDEE
jgi:hypothetical protein